MAWRQCSLETTVPARRLSSISTSDDSMTVEHFRRRALHDPAQPRPRHGPSDLADAARQRSASVRRLMTVSTTTLQTPITEQDFATCSALF
jgi:hypothetical protein